MVGAFDFGLQDERVRGDGSAGGRQVSFANNRIKKNGGTLIREGGMGVDSHVSSFSQDLEVLPVTRSKVPFSQLSSLRMTS